MYLEILSLNDQIFSSRMTIFTLIMKIVNNWVCLHQLMITVSGWFPSVWGCWWWVLVCLARVCVHVTGGCESWVSSVLSSSGVTVTTCSTPHLVTTVTTSSSQLSFTNTLTHWYISGRKLISQYYVITLCWRMHAAHCDHGSSSSVSTLSVRVLTMMIVTIDTGLDLE